MPKPTSSLRLSVAVVVVVLSLSALVVGEVLSNPQASVIKHKVNDARYTYVSPFAPQVSYVGRVVPSHDNQWAQFDWSAVEIHLNVTGVKGVSAIFNGIDSEDDYNVFLDGALVGILNTTKGQQTTYRVIAGLDRQKTYQLELLKRTEALFGVASFGGFVLDDLGLEDIELDLIQPMENYPVAGLKKRSAVFDRRIEFIGDSISCGYGIDGKFPCHFSAGTENSFHTYGSLISRYFGAQLHLECWSGKGVVRNYGDKNQMSVDPFPVYYPRTLANVPSTSWNFASWVPNAVVINLGTNDYSTQPAPSANQFETGYYNFINKIKAEYSSNPKLQIFLVCGPIIGNPCCDYVKTVAKTEGLHYIDMQGILKYPDDYGCDGHPNAGGHKKMAAVAQPIIQAVMGWA